MPHRDWNATYAEGFIPWDSKDPDPHLVDFVREHPLDPCRVLDIGCGTGTHTLWLAEHGFDVVGVDLSERAIELARAKSVDRPGSFRFAVLDFLTAMPEGAPFDFVFDRGCFHVFDEAAERARFASRVAGCLKPAGEWLSLMGSTEGPPRDHGPPRRSARDIADAIEPVLEIVDLRAIEFAADLPTAARAWRCLSRVRTVPAQPSTVHPLL